MENVILTSYNLDVALKKLTLSGIVTVDRLKVMAIINQAAGRENVIYRTGRPGPYRFTVAGNELTFNELPPGTLATDPLQIIYDGTDSVPVASTPITAAAANTSLVAANVNRKDVFIDNNSTSILYVKFSTGASASSYNMVVQPNTRTRREDLKGYKGALFGFWASANGQAVVTEFSY